MTISVGVVCYNHAPFLRQCIDSLLAQTLMPDEIIIGDDASTDESWNIIQEYQNQYQIIKAYRHCKNNGAFFNGTFIARKLTGDFVSIIDGDDYWHPEKLKKEIAAINNTGADIAYSDSTTVTEQGEIIGYWTKRVEIPPDGDMFIPVLARRFFNEGQNIFRNELVSRKAFNSEGECDPALQNFWDWDRKIRYTRTYSAAFSGANLVFYRQHPGGISKTFGQKNLYAAMVQVYEKHLPSLAVRPLRDQVFVRISFEILAATQREQLGITDNQNYSYPNVYQRIMSQIRCLSKTEQAELNNIFFSELTRIVPVREDVSV